MKKINLCFFIVLYELVFFLILYKVLNVPITHDETATTVHYINFSTWEIMMYPDSWPNNHILNTLAVKFLVLFFEKEQWIVRLPNLISFLVYAFGVFRILKYIVKQESILYIPAAILFIANPFLLDFFGLCRGYGMASAFATLSVSYLLTGFKFELRKHIWMGLFLSMIASYANFTLLVFWATVTIISAGYFIYTSFSQKKKMLNPLLTMLFLSGLYVLLIANPIIKMQSENQFQFWTSDGFYKDTILSSIYCWRYGSNLLFDPSPNTIGVSVLLIIPFALFYIIKKSINSGFKLTGENSPIIISLIILIGAALISICQSILLNSPNLSGRTALFFYPLYIVALLSFLKSVSSALNSKLIKFSFALCLAILPACHLASTYSSKNAREWWLDENNIEVLDYLKKQQAEKITLKTNWLFHPSLVFYSYTGKTPWLELYPYDKNIEPETSAQYYYILSEDYKVLEKNFDIVYKFADDRWLLKKKTISPTGVGN